MSATSRPYRGPSPASMRPSCRDRCWHRATPAHRVRRRVLRRARERTPVPRSYLRRCRRRSRSRCHAELLWPRCDPTQCIDCVVDCCGPRMFRCPAVIECKHGRTGTGGQTAAGAVVSLDHPAAAVEVEHECGLRSRRSVQARRPAVGRHGESTTELISGPFGLVAARCSVAARMAAAPVSAAGGMCRALKSFKKAVNSSSARGPITSPRYPFPARPPVGQWPRPRTRSI